MGTKRTVDSHRKDSLGRPIKVSAPSESVKTRRDQVGTSMLSTHDGDTYDTQMNLSAATHRVVDALSAAGLQPVLVGGCVRDHIMGHGGAPKDVDIEVYGAQSFDQVEGVLSKVGRTGAAGRSFGVLKSTVAGEEFDVSLPRKDSLADGGNTHRSIHAEVDPTLTLEEASYRRDFTFNALAYDPVTFQVVDYHGGVEDIQVGVIRVVDRDTFAEDPLRVLRGVQFAGRFDMEMDEDTIDVCRSMSHAGLAKERVAGEFMKMVNKSQNLHAGVQALHDVQWSDLTPTLGHNDTPVNQDVVNMIQSTCNKDHTAGLVTGLMDHHYGDSSGALAKSMMLSGPQRRAMYAVADLPRGDDLATRSRMARSLHRMGIDQDGVDTTISSIGVTPARRLWVGAPPEYAVSGDSLISRGLEPGPDFKEIISRCANLQDSGHHVDDQVLTNVIRDVQQGKDTVTR